LQTVDKEIVKQKKIFHCCKYFSNKQSNVILNNNIAVLAYDMSFCRLKLLLNILIIQHHNW